MLTKSRTLLKTFKNIPDDVLHKIWGQHFRNEDTRRLRNEEIRRYIETENEFNRLRFRFREARQRGEVLNEELNNPNMNRGRQLLETIIPSIRRSRIDAMQERIRINQEEIQASLDEINAARQLIEGDGAETLL